MKTLLVLAAISIFSKGINASIKPSGLFTDNMVLQREKVIPVWGKADIGETVRVNIGGQQAAGKADSNGNWIVRLSPMDAGGPFEMIIEGKNKIILKNIMIGEVWLCSGQSNMELALGKTENAEKEIAQAGLPAVRLFIVKHLVAGTPQTECSGEWVECTPKTSAGFSAAAYYFGKELNNTLKIPVGLIQSTWGGTAAECWMPEEVLAKDDDFCSILSRWDKMMNDYPRLISEFNEKLPALTGQWKSDSAKAVTEGKALPRKPAAPDAPGSRNTPAGLYNGMISPLIPFAFRGVIWYQGEANAKRAYQYRRLFPALINCWREKWGAGNFPFYYVQLPNLDREPEPSKSGWAELREAQLMTLSVPNTAMAVTIDIGDAKDLHPLNKKDVGLRLALIAKALTYRLGNEYSGPVLKDFNIEEDKISINFEHCSGGLITKNGGSLHGFTICGEDGKFFPAEAVIKGCTVLVWNNQVKKPLNVRYAWADNPECNLYNTDMLPASPFRTDAPTEVTFRQ